MQNSISAVKEYLSQKEDGYLFSINELLDFASYEKIKKKVQQIEMLNSCEL